MYKQISEIKLSRHSLFQESCRVTVSPMKAVMSQHIFWNAVMSPSLLGKLSCHCLF